MFIDKVNYQTNLVDIQNIRYLLFTNLYGNEAFINSLTGIISRYIDCLNIDYSASNYTYTIKIKKTAMRKNHGFDHNPKYYYQIIPNIFKEFIQINQSAILSVLNQKYANAQEIMNSLICSDFYCLANLCQISCIADNILIIKL